MSSKRRRRNREALRRALRRGHLAIHPPRPYVDTSRVKTTDYTAPISSPGSAEAENTKESDE